MSMFSIASAHLHAGLCDGLLEGVEVHHHQVDQLDPVLPGLGEVLRRSRRHSRPPWIFGMQGLDPAVHDLGQPRVPAHLGDRQPRSPPAAGPFPRSRAGCIHASHQRRGEIGQAAFVTDREEGEFCHGGVLGPELQRRSRRQKVEKRADLATLETSCFLRSNIRLTPAHVRYLRIGRQRRRTRWSPPPSVSPASNELPGLTARLDKLCHHHGGASLPQDKPHAFVYFITIHNGSDRTVTLLGRKWVLENADGTRLVVEGDKIVGETPRLSPGRAFFLQQLPCDGDRRARIRQLPRGRRPGAQGPCAPAPVRPDHPRRLTAVSRRGPRSAETTRRIPRGARAGGRPGRPGRTRRPPRSRRG